MLLFRKPRPETIRRFLDRQNKLDLSYEAVGATAGEIPGGYVYDQTRGQVGDGEAAFEAAKLALHGWRQLSLGWLSVWPTDREIREGAAIVIVARWMGVWWLNACRIVSVIDEPAGPRRWGFAYGTLPDHAGSGEERFLVEMHEDGTVWYDIRAFSRPQHPLARLGYYFMRRVQRRFGRESLAAVRQFVASALQAQAAP